MEFLSLKALFRDRHRHQSKYALNRVYYPTSHAKWMLNLRGMNSMRWLMVQTLKGWSLKGFYSRRDLRQDIAEETHYFTVLEKAY